jgi:DNA-binding MurR/RpiR family transcriptional regulator
MKDDILAVLEEKGPTFSKGQRKIAGYIMDSYDKAAFMTASRLGKTVGVSESTVVRFAVELLLARQVRKFRERRVKNSVRSAQM